VDSDELTIRHYLKSRFENTFEDRVRRSLEIRSQAIIPHHHFTQASTECVYLYRDGYFLATAMATQALNEAIIRFVAERNGIPPNQEPPPELVALFATQGIVSNGCVDAMHRILRSFRNDFHHLNPSIAKVPVEVIAKRNIEDIAMIEGELFEHSSHEGKLSPKHEQYWNVNTDGTILVNLRPG